MHVRLAADSWRGAQIARDERYDRSRTRKNGDGENGGVVQHPAGRKRGGSGRVEVNPRFRRRRHPDRHADRAAGRPALRGDWGVAHGRKCRGNDEVVAEEELAGSGIGVGFKRIGELRG
jgi:hypothetical protein